MGDTEHIFKENALLLKVILFGIVQEVMPYQIIVQVLSGYPFKVAYEGL